MNHLSAQTIQHLMRKHHKTIRGIAQEWNLTLKRVRHVRLHGVEGEVFVMDWLEILTGDPGPMPSWASRRD
jgi:hypothetical protein